jgi:hypothetical protein
MAIILKVNKVNLFVSSVLFVFWYHSPNLLEVPRIWKDGRREDRNMLQPTGTVFTGTGFKLFSSP